MTDLHADQPDSISQEEQQNQYILKAFEYRKKVTQGVVFGDDISRQQQKSEILPHNLSSNQNLQNYSGCQKQEDKISSKRDVNNSESKKEDKQFQMREAEKRLIEEEEIERRQAFDPECLQQSFSNGQLDLDFNPKPPSNIHIVPEENKHVSNIQRQEQQSQQEQKHQQEIRQPQKQIQILKHKLQRLSLFNEGHIHPIIKAVSQNNKIIQMTQKRFEDQNTILSQFKEETSKKLEENIKNTLKEKMNEMNRDNAKELKDIKNMSLFMQELLEKYSSKMDRIEKNIDDILKNNQKK